MNKQELIGSVADATGLTKGDAGRAVEAVFESVAGALKKGGLSARDLVSVGITNQRETSLLWDRSTGAPVHNALVWMDTRTDALVAQFERDGGKDRLREETGLPLAMAEDPLSSVVLGAGKMLSDFNLLRKISID